MNHQQALGLLRTALDDPQAEFRGGQWEAIDALVNQSQKLLVVQRTGWGKSSVYFISTRIFRDRGRGLTIIVSPLLALMRNQIDSAARLGIRAVTLNSSNTDEWGQIRNQILQNKVDCLLISPERLANDEFVDSLLLPIADNIGLMVVDEAHCISDWGHDFRPDYRRIVQVLRQLPSNTPILGTTATANNRVVEDIQTQLGNIVIQRGPLIRESLSLQTIILQDQASRLAWLAAIIPQIEGTGIVYTLTKRDADQVAQWLVEQGINAKAYYSGVTHPDFVDKNEKPDSNAFRQHLENQLLTDQIDVLVATTALGMGYDKPDLGFVIHYQAPGSIVAYYQQVGRAGRAIESSVGILMSGKEDNDIHEFFRNSAFPSGDEVDQLLSALAHSDGLTVRQLEEETNLSYGQINKALKLLRVENPAPVIKMGNQWNRLPIHYQMDHDRIQHLTSQREEEWQEVQQYLSEDQCLMTFLRNALDDPSSEPCGRCANCRRAPILETTVPSNLAHQAAVFLKHAEAPIKPKKQVAVNAFPVYGFKGNLPPHLQAQEGKALSRWGDAGWGWMVAEDKHTGRFRDELVEAAAEMIRDRWSFEEEPAWVTCVPSRNHPELVPDFARRLAAQLELPFVDAVYKIRDNAQQKFQQNRYRQCRNLDGIFGTQSVQPGSVLLVDDIVDSGWTLAVIAALLQNNGSGKVYPVTLASTSTGDS